MASKVDAVRSKVQTAVTMKEVSKELQFTSVYPHSWSTGEICALGCKEHDTGCEGTWQSHKHHGLTEDFCCDGKNFKIVLCQVIL